MENIETVFCFRPMYPILRKILFAKHSVLNHMKLAFFAVKIDLGPLCIVFFTCLYTNFLIILFYIITVFAYLVDLESVFLEFQSINWQQQRLSFRI